MGGDLWPGAHAWSCEKPEPFSTRWERTFTAEHASRSIRVYSWQFWLHLTVLANSERSDNRIQKSTSKLKLQSIHFRACPWRGTPPGLGQSLWRFFDDNGFCRSKLMAAGRAVWRRSGWLFPIRSRLHFWKFLAHYPRFPIICAKLSLVIHAICVRYILKRWWNAFALTPDQRPKAIFVFPLDRPSWNF